MTAARAPAGLAPGFLVASPTLADPNFDGSLVLMAEHHGQGALGFVVNRPGPIAVADVLRGLDGGLAEAAEASGRLDGQVLSGGPVSPERLWVLYRPGPALADEATVRVGRLHFQGTKEGRTDATGRFRIGGLTPENVGAGVRAAKPWGVDVSSGVEASPGRKDPVRMRRFVAAVRENEPAQYEGSGNAPYDWMDD